MFRCYCDICGADITDYRSERAEASAGRLRISVMTAIDGVWNGGHACLDCIKAACAGLSVPRRQGGQPTAEDVHQSAAADA